MRRVTYGLLLIALFAVWIAGVKASATVDETLPSNYVPSGKLMYQQYCATCHGPRAQGMATFPRLAGQHAPYLLRQLLVIQSVLRVAPVMHGIVKDLTKDQMQAVVAYLESL